MKIAVHMWKDLKDGRPWAEVIDEGRGHLLAQLLHGNLCDVGGVEQVKLAAKNSVDDLSYAVDLGFFDSIAISFSEGKALLEHACEAYDTFTIDARSFSEVLDAWKAVLEHAGLVERTIAFEWNTDLQADQ